MEEKLIFLFCFDNKVRYIVSFYDIICMMYVFFCLDFVLDINKSMKLNEYLYF